MKKNVIHKSTKTVHADNTNGIIIDCSENKRHPIVVHFWPTGQDMKAPPMKLVLSYLQARSLVQVLSEYYNDGPALVIDIADRPDDRFEPDRS